MSSFQREYFFKRGKISPIQMLCVSVGPGREVQAILSVYLSTFLAGYGTGFSAVAVPGIQEEMR